MRHMLMLATVTGSPDGIETETFEEGREYPVKDAPAFLDLAEVFMREDFETADGRRGPVAVWADEVGAPVIETTVEDVTDTAAICGSLTSRGTICEQRRPCRWHSEG